MLIANLIFCNCSVTAVKKRIPQLSVVVGQSTNILPKEPVTYTKQTQTNTTGPERDGKFCTHFSPQRESRTNQVGCLNMLNSLLELIIKY